MAKDRILKMAIPSDPDQIRIVEAEAEKIAKLAGLSEDEQESLSIAITEVVANAIIHGNKKDIKKQVNLEFRISKSKLFISIEDEGRGFDPHGIADPLAPENLYKDSGRGVFIVRTLMDDVQYYFGERGTRVEMTKNLKK